METDDRGVKIEQGHSVLADVQARELELERILEEARQEAKTRLDRAKTEAGALVRDARTSIDRRRKEKSEAIIGDARTEAEAKRRENGVSHQALQDRIAEGIPRAVEETVRAILPDGFVP